MTITIISLDVVFRECRWKKMGFQQGDEQVVALMIL